MIGIVVALAGCGVDCPECGPVAPPPEDTDGWDDPPGAGRAYVLEEVTIADAMKGFDLDGWCPSGECVDNRIGALSGLLAGAIEEAHDLGYGRTVLELSGVDEPFTGDDARVTIKAYEVSDATLDETDDFGPIGSCCRYQVTERSLFGDPHRARFRMPGLYEAGRARDAGTGDLAIVFPSSAPALLPIQGARFSASTSPHIEPRLQILLGGAVSVADLARMKNPLCRGDIVDTYCRAVDATLLDLLVDRGLHPDIDRDGDGLETFELDEATGRVGKCFDGCREGCPSRLPIAPVDPARAESCAENGAMRDGYSIAWDITKATPAVIVPANR